MSNFTIPASGNRFPITACEAVRMIAKILRFPQPDDRLAIEREEAMALIRAMELLSRASEGENAPRLEIEGDRKVTWIGTWTTARWVAVEFLEGDQALLSWDSGTGKPSRFLGEVLPPEFVRTPVVA